MQIGRLLGLQQAGVERGRGDDVAHAQAGRQDFGERAQINHALGPARQQGRGRGLVKPQLAIRVVFDDGQARVAAHGNHGLAARFVHGAAGGVLEVGQQVHGARTRAALQRLAQAFRLHAAIVAGHAVDLRLHGGESLQRAQVGGRFHQQAAALVQQDLGHQIQPLLAAGGDQHLIGRDLRAVAGHFSSHPLAQLGQAFAGGVLQRGARDRAAFGQDAGAGLAHGLDRKGLGRGQAARKVEDAGPFGDFQNLADGRGVHGRGALGQLPDKGERHGVRGFQVQGMKEYGAASGRGHAGQSPTGLSVAPRGPRPRRHSCNFMQQAAG